MSNTYWNNKGLHQALAEELQKLIPIEGGVDNPRKNRALEKFRKAANCYYDLYNNGLINRAQEFAKVFGIKSSLYRYNARYGRKFDQALYARVEDEMDLIIAAAAVEQKLLDKDAVLTA